MTGAVSLNGDQNLNMVVKNCTVGGKRGRPSGRPAKRRREKVVRGELAWGVLNETAETNNKQ